ncbi:MAG: hypothetical protein HW394_1601 [Acidobacteria bacterium]|nr:hypothetical protein [Acidobacteriota bacterium]
MKRLLALGMGFVAALTAWPSAQSATGDFQIATVSARPDFVSGGDVLIRIRVPRAVSLDAPQVMLNGADITGVFRRDVPGHALAGLVTGLKLGPNTVVVSPGDRGTNGGGRLTVLNHPIVGPVFSGPHEEPFVCETERFTLQSGDTLGKPLDAQCSVNRRVDYYYRSTAGGALKPLPSSATPPDLAQVTTLTGSTVPYIVRIETGTINRGIYQIAMLHNPASAPAPDPWTRPAGWNGRLIYTHGGGCTGGWYRQGANTGGVVDAVMLRQGYAVASSSLNVFGNNCNDLLTSETMMMVKERFIEGYGAPAFTIGWGCSGGSYQQLQTADNYPGLLDGIIPCRTFPDVGFATIPTITDARLLNRYFTSAALPFSEDQKRAVAGFLTLATMVQVDTDGAGRIHVSEFCPEVLPVALRYHPSTNPKGARCDVYDHAANAYGRDPNTGFARRPLDNVGIQYGLQALNAGTISQEQFLDLNARIGGFDNDGNVVSSRSVADPVAMRAAYRTGRLTNTGGGLASVPVIDYRNYLDDAVDGDVHVRFHSFSLRERLIKANGQADNHVILVEDNRYRGNSSSPVYQDALAQMERWLTAISADTSADPAIVKIRRAKPADLVDACWTRDAAPKKVAETQTRAPSSRCEQLYPSASFPREVAGGPVANDVIKCQLKPVDASDYKVALTPGEVARLETIFPAGVCDWSKPGVEQQKPSGTWLRFGGSGT